MTNDEAKAADSLSTQGSLPELEEQDLVNITGTGKGLLNCCTRPRTSSPPRGATSSTTADVAGPSSSSSEPPTKQVVDNMEWEQYLQYKKGIMNTKKEWEAQTSVLTKLPGLSLTPGGRWHLA